MPYKWSEGKLIERKYSPSDVLRILESAEIDFVNLQFSDLLGRLKQVTIPSYKFNEESFKEGFNKLDGSGIRGFSTIEDSDMVLLPDPNTFAILPWTREKNKTARLIADVYTGMGRGRLKRDPRYIAQSAERYLNDKYGMKSLWGPELEFFVFDGVKWDTMNPYFRQSYEISSNEAPWSNSSYRAGFKDAYYAVPPIDSLESYRNTVSNYLSSFGIIVEAHHHEVAAAGQIEINIYQDTLTNTADSILTLKLVAKTVAAEMGKVATFMPKPIYGDNASGMHTHISLWRGEENAFYDPLDEYAELSQLGRYFVGGLLEHSRSLAAIVAPTTNSYKRLVPGFEAPVYITWSRANRSVIVRIPAYYKRKPGHKRIEYRTPDPSCNPYLAFSAILLAGLDGIDKKIDPGDPIDEDVYKIPPNRRRELGIKELPRSLKEAVEELKSDHEYLKPIYSSDIIDFIVDKGEREYLKLQQIPHPFEFEMYFNL